MAGQSTILCGIMIYGVEYIRKKRPQLLDWQRMNPGVEFKIITTDIDNLGEPLGEPALTEQLSELGIGVEIIPKGTYPFLDWLVANIVRLESNEKLEQPRHFISDIMRWYCLDFLRGRNQYTCVMEADLECNSGWIQPYFEEHDLKNKLTIFGEDRAFIVYNNASDNLARILAMLDNLYKFIVKTKVLDQGNFPIPNEPITDIEAYKKTLTYQLAQYEKIIEKPPVGAELDKHISGFISEIPCSPIMGIGIRTTYPGLFNLTYTKKSHTNQNKELPENSEDPELVLKYYTHEKKEEWKQCSRKQQAFNGPTQPQDNGGYETEEELNGRMPTQPQGNLFGPTQQVVNSGDETEEESQFKRQRTSGGSKKIRKSKKGFKARSSKKIRKSKKGFKVKRTRKHIRKSLKKRPLS